MKPGRPVLYELLTSRNGTRESGPRDERIGRDVPADEPTMVEQPPGWLPQARTLRIPVGYVFIAVAGLILIGAATFIWGYTRGKDEGLDAADQNQAAFLEAQRIGAELSEPGGGESRGGASPAGLGREASGGSTGERREAAWGPLESDPREVGLNYFAVVQTSRENAVEVASFCRDNGLEAYAVRVNNGGFRVYILPGFDADDRSSGPVKRLEGEIQRVKQKWDIHVGRDELANTAVFAEKYKG